MPSRMISASFFMRVGVLDGLYMDRAVRTKLCRWPTCFSTAWSMPVISSHCAPAKNPDGDCKDGRATGMCRPILPCKMLTLNLSHTRYYTDSAKRNTRQQACKVLLKQVTMGHSNCFHARLWRLATPHQGCFPLITADQPPNGLAITFSKQTPDHTRIF